MRRPWFALAVGFIALSPSCKTDGGGGGGPVPTTLTLAPTSLSFTTVGRQQTLTPTLLDQNGAPISATITWTSNNPAVASVIGGLVSAIGNGATRIRAVAGSARDSVTVTVTQVAFSVSKIAGDNQSGVTNSAAGTQLVVQVDDTLGNPIPGANVAFAASLGGGNVAPANQSTGANGRNAGVTWTFGGTVGAQQATATVAALTPVMFNSTVASNLGTVALHEGNNQTGLQTFALNIRPAVIVKDTLSVPKAGVTVNFTVTGGGGSVTGGSAISDSAGIARVGNWVVQNGANTLQAVVATAGYQGGPINFSATGVAGTYNVEIQFLTSMTPSQMNTFTLAETRWEQIIFGDLPNVTLPAISAGQCGPNSPAIPAGTVIDDVRIYASIVPIDGPGGVLGSAGFCAFRTPGDPLPLLGLMRFDSADVVMLESAGLLDETIMHEMGHVFGFGGLWDNVSLLVDSGTVDPYFQGAAAIAKFNELGGASYAGDKVPVENTGGLGTADAHWRETVLQTELMTGFLNGGQANPISAISSASMDDMGYTVNHAATDAYSVPAAAGVSALRGNGTVIHLVSDVLRLPVMVIDARGRVVRIIQP